MSEIKIHNVETNEEIQREMTDAELSQLELDKLNAQKIAEAEADLAATKAVLLAKLGITEEEAKLLLS